MNPSTFHRLRRMVVLGAVIAGATASAAGAVGRPPDVQDTSANLAAQISPPDVRDAAAATTAIPDVFERYAAAHPFGVLSSRTVSISRPPDVADAALTVQYGSPSVAGNDFHWGDWAIGIGSGMGLVALCGVVFLMSRQVRHSVQTA